MVYKETLILHSEGKRPIFHDITNEVRSIVSRSGIRNGTVTIQSQHTTCSLIFEEFVHDRDYNGYDFLQIDLLRILNKLIPMETSEGTDYRYPGPAHTAFALDYETSEKFDLSCILNADSHLRGSLFGPSECFVIEDGIVLTGSFGYIYFTDWERQRARDRKCHILVMGE